MKIKSFFDNRTWTLTYVVWDEATRDALIIDPVLDYDPVGSKIWTESVDQVLAFVAENSLTPHYVLETHAHADHLSGSQMIKEKYPKAKVGISERITDVQSVFKGVFDLPQDFATDGRQFDKLLTDGEVIRAGALEVKVIATPGHTPACASFEIDDAVFTGDAIFMPDMGTGRCDFPAGSAEDLYDSVQKLYSMPDATRVFVGHDYMPNGRELAYETTIGAEKQDNIQLKAGTTREEFIKFRTDRDKTLSAPTLLFQSVQVNVDAGALPEAHANEQRYLRIPINIFRPEPAGDMELQEI